MRAIAHPFFETLYIDPETGLYWEEEKNWAKGNTCLFSLLIEDSAKVTPEAVEFAVSALADVAALNIFARKALQNNRTHQPYGAVATFCQQCVVPVSGSLLSQSIQEDAAQTLTEENFLQLLRLTLVAVYPEQEEAPLMLEYALPQGFESQQTLQVLFSRLGDPLDVLYGNTEQ